jgi:hypothetical protein
MESSISAVKTNQRQVPEYNNKGALAMAGFAGKANSHWLISGPPLWTKGFLLV